MFVFRKFIRLKPHPRDSQRCSNSPNGNNSPSLYSDVRDHLRNMYTTKEQELKSIKDVDHEEVLRSIQDEINNIENELKERREKKLNSLTDTTLTDQPVPKHDNNNRQDKGASLGRNHYTDQPNNSRKTSNQRSKSRYNNNNNPRHRNNNDSNRYRYNNYNRHRYNSRDDRQYHHESRYSKNDLRPYRQSRPVSPSPPRHVDLNRSRNYPLNQGDKYDWPHSLVRNGINQAHALVRPFLVMLLSWVQVQVIFYPVL